MKRFVFSLAICLAVAQPGLVRGQLLLDRLFLLPTQVGSGPGTVRLDGMGGLRTSVADENNEIELFDYSRNPAGYGDDRDSWSIDVRYVHDELTDRSEATNGDDVRLNDGSFDIGFHDPGNLGAGGRIDFTELESNDFFSEKGSFQLSGFSFFINKYLFRTVSLGASVKMGSETQDGLTSSIYNISHEGDILRLGLGGAWIPLEGVTIGTRGELIENTIQGKSLGPFHEDSFDWERPGGLVAVQGFVNRGRLDLGVDYTYEEVEGKETVDVSWSSRFTFNPTDRPVAFTERTFTEARSSKRLRTRARLEAIPRKLAVSGSFALGQDDLTVATNPNLIGSLPGTDLAVEEQGLVLGASWVGARERLLLAGEVELGNRDVTETVRGSGVQDSRETFAIRAGGEYLVGESLVGRAGLERGSDELKLASAEQFSGTYDRTQVSLGLGLIPAGGIWQIDFSYSFLLSSDLDGDRDRLAAYVKYLF